MGGGVPFVTGIFVTDIFAIGLGGNPIVGLGGNIGPLLILLLSSSDCDVVDINGEEGKGGKGVLLLLLLLLLLIGLFGLFIGNAGALLIGNAPFGGNLGTGGGISSLSLLLVFLLLFTFDVIIGGGIVGNDVVIGGELVFIFIFVFIFVFVTCIPAAVFNALIHDSIYKL